MPERIKIALAQLNTVVGDVAGNTAMILAAIETARDTHGADLVIFPELAVCGYPPEDLLFHAGLQNQVHASLESIRAGTRGIAALVGYPEYAAGEIFNSAAWFADGEHQANYRKQYLPNYSVFDEERYFSAGSEAVVATIKGVRVGLTICEDIWEPGPCARAAAAGAQLIVAINGSPFDYTKQATRESVVQARCREVELPILYANLVGGQDELVFDGSSAVFAADGRIAMRAPAFEAGIYCAGFSASPAQLVAEPGSVAELLDETEGIYTALVVGVRDYVRKNGFPGVVLGLSGGIDSALTLAIAVDALGAESVQAVMMPYRYTADISIEDAEAQARRLGVDYQVLPIEAMVAATRETLAGLFAGLAVDTTEENIQSRCRGVLLMAISNKIGRMVLATGNKSEMAVGYATLYGDMNGGFAPIKDCDKTLIYRLARYRNAREEVIPVRVIEREPSAELAPGQKDIDSLPPYAVLDPILDALMVENLSANEIIARGFDREVVLRILAMVRRNEYKRRQAAPGVRITSRAFGRDWRYPITSGYRFST
ncbi:MAG: NAD+ synthase [Gammaproteobacteria bacterium]|nr:MAG: NAD+ synthase [Gammaproteobacteria bacterium]